MSAIRHLEGTHQSRVLNAIICNRCGYKTSLSAEGRSVMRGHLAAKHPPESPQKPSAVTS